MTLNDIGKGVTLSSDVDHEDGEDGWRELKIVS